MKKNSATLTRERAIPFHPTQQDRIRLLESGGWQALPLPKAPPGRDNGTHIASCKCDQCLMERQEMRNG